MKKELWILWISQFEQDDVQLRVLESGNGERICDQRQVESSKAAECSQLQDVEARFEIEDVFEKLDTDEDCRVVILSGEGKAFSSGLDIKDGGLMDLVTLQGGEDIARKARQIRRKIIKMQQAFTNIEKEVDVGLAADVGSLNRLPKICGNESWLREVALTARHFTADEALKFDLISCAYNGYDEMMREILVLAKAIAEKSPVAVQGTKIILNYSRDHTVDEGLQAVATWNQSQLLTEDIMKSGLAAITKSPLPPFSKL
ncbi:Enoyl-CoA hydratase/isomerase family protein [Trichostrongylus colubriformis]|uniref:Enoyl-CoA hydratase/isomerase family protein n=1 Tax=Trichostrongylus colubriformis TaxID=6319 RepID=A0AAN8IQE1_TRICO